MPIIDGNSLRAIDFLYFVYKISLHSFASFDTQDVLGISMAVSKEVTGLHMGTIYYFNI